ncbi:MAG: hypothetical protein COC15_04060 [Legionellales bacterium]|nr:MAG: hypothetical protein COC15_04060 [Legionellales bacterium]
MYIQLIVLLISALTTTTHATTLEHTLQKNNINPSKYIIDININLQTLSLLRYNSPNNYSKIKDYSISSSKRGLGQIYNTYKTPQGLHKIVAKFGHTAPKYAIFKSRRHVATWKPKPRRQHFRDYILTRILHLSGLESGFNNGHNNNGAFVDSFARGIYIHGTTMTWKLGTPSSIGCIHMHPDDVIDLFDAVPTGTLVWIHCV